MSKLNDTNNEYKRKKKTFDEKIVNTKQRINALLSDIDNISIEMSDNQDKTKVNRSKNRIRESLNDLKKELDDFINEQKQSIEDQYNKKIEDYNKKLERKTEKEKKNAELRLNILNSLLAGQPIEFPKTDEILNDIEEVEQETKTMSDIEYRYYYKNVKGIWIAGLGEDVKKRKYFELDVYTVDDKLLNRCGMKRSKYFWNITYEENIDRKINKIKKTECTFNDIEDILKDTNIIDTVKKYFSNYKNSTFGYILNGNIIINIYRYV